MRPLVSCIVLVLSSATMAFAEDPAPAAAPTPIPRTHVDTTVVGDAGADNSGAPPASGGLENYHHFEAGAPDIVSAIRPLHLSAKQDTQVKNAIQRADAGAAVLIKREHDLEEMIAATTPQDPLYAKLINDQSAGISLWTENRNALRREVANLLTPAQRARFEEQQAAHGGGS